MATIMSGFNPAEALNNLAVKEELV